MLDQIEEDFLATLPLEIESDASFIGVEVNEVAAIHTLGVCIAITPRIALRGLFDFYDVGAEPCENLGAGRARLKLRQVNYSDPL